MRYRWGILDIALRFLPRTNWANWFLHSIRMAGELESSRTKIDESARALTETNTELEQRRRHIETILESIPTGVLSLDPERRVTHSNVAFGRMFWPNGGAPVIGSTLQRGLQR